MVDLGKRDAVPDHGLAELLVPVGHDMRGVDQPVARQVADRAAVAVGGEHALAERGLVQALLDLAEGVAVDVLRPASARALRRRPAAAVSARP